MKLPFLFGIHCHQPVDNFHSVVDEAIEKSYRPFMHALAEFPGFKCAVHFSGWLLRYIQQQEPSFFSDLQALAKNWQIEFVTGGFYEPVLAAIPSRDRKGQIRKLSEYIGEHFGQTPRGLWLTERVWDPSIVPDLAACGVEYAMVDDYHFLSAGYAKDSLRGYYLTEQDGIPLKILPIDQQLRYMTPFKPFPMIAQYLETIQTRPGSMAMVFDDGEKFGIWPKTWQWVYEKKWLFSFLEGICNSDHVKSTHFSDFLASASPMGLAYLPTVSYMEMGEWSLFANKIKELEILKSHLTQAGLSEMILPFVKGGIWKNFFAKYPESNWIHKRSLHLSRRAAQANDPKILDSLYRSQCNDVLWHGLFGGLYLPNLRNNAYRSLIETSALLDTKEKISFPVCHMEDINYNGYNEAVLASPDLEVWFTARDGGQLVELDCKKTRINLLNTLARRKEGYHCPAEDSLAASGRQDQPDEGIVTIHENHTGIAPDMEKLMIHDWYNRYGFIDHVVKSFALDEFIHMGFEEMGDFVNQPFTITREKNSILCSRQGGIYEHGRAHDTVLQKRFSLDSRILNFAVDLKTEYPGQLSYVLETNWHIYNYDSLVINGTPFREQHFFSGQDFMIQDRTMPLNIVLHFDQKVSMDGFAIETLSQSEKGIDLTCQGICLLVPITGSGHFAISGSVAVVE